MEEEKFEKMRIELFKKYGFEGNSKLIKDRNNNTIYSLIGGSDNGTLPKIFIHGGLSELSGWSQVVGNLEGKIILIDRPGCGLTYKLDYLKVDFRETAEHYMEDVFEGLGIEKADLIANSMGSFFALVFALKSPEKVNRLVLIGAPVGLHKTLPLLVRLWGNRFFGQIIKRLNTTEPEEFRKRVLGGLLVSNPQDVPLAFIECAINASHLPEVSDSSYTMLRSVSTLRGMHPKVFLFDEIHNIKHPTLFIWGDDDKFADVSNIEDIILQMPNMRLEVINNAGHVMHLEKPKIVTNLIEEFVS